MMLMTCAIRLVKKNDSECRRAHRYREHTFYSSAIIAVQLIVAFARVSAGRAGADACARFRHDASFQIYSAACRQEIGYIFRLLPAAADHAAPPPLCSRAPFAIPHIHAARITYARPRFAPMPVV